MCNLFVCRNEAASLVRKATNGKLYQRFTYIGLINSSGIYKTEILDKTIFLCLSGSQITGFLGPEGALVCLSAAVQGLQIGAGPGPKGGKPHAFVYCPREQGPPGSCARLFPKKTVAVWMSRKSELYQGHLGRKGLVRAVPKPALIVVHRCRVQSAEAEVRGSH